MGEGQRLGRGSGAGHTVPVEVPPGRRRIGILGPVELVGEGPVPLGGAKERWAATTRW